MIMVVIPKNVVAVLLLVTILVSVIGTWAALSTLTPTTFQRAPTPMDTSQVTGKVTVYVMPPPPEATGEVIVDVVE